MHNTQASKFEEYNSFKRFLIRFGTRCELKKLDISCKGNVGYAKVGNPTPLLCLTLLQTCPEFAIINLLQMSNNLTTTSHKGVEVVGELWREGSTPTP